jgi:hypothetical protein
MNGIPLPDIVLQIITVGSSLINLAWFKALMISLMLCPLTSITFQLKLSYFCFNDSSGIISSVKPSI